MLIIQIYLKWEQLLILIVKYDDLSIFNTYIFIGYFERYKNMKILQIQSSGDEFFLPDNEVK
jgi:hypothetical protein